MASRVYLAVLAAALFISSPSFASDQWNAQNTTQLLGVIANSMQPSAGAHQPVQREIDTYNRYNSGYQTREQIGQGLRGNVMNNLNQLPQQQYIPSQVNGYTNNLINGQMPNVQGDLQNQAAGHARNVTNQYLPRGVSVDPVQLLQQR